MSNKRVAINGFGRIGRLTLRAFLEARRKELDFVAINDLGSAEMNAHLLEFDTVHGRFPGKVSAANGHLKADGHDIAVLAEANPEKLPWRDLGIDIVMECTGRFADRDSASKHLTAGAKRVLVSAPCKNADLTVVYGVNDEKLTQEHHVVSNASCTTNCLAPVASVLNKAIGIEHGYMTTIHAYTGDQRTVDTLHKDPYRARAAAANLIPTSTGAAKAVGLVLPGAQGQARRCLDQGAGAECEHDRSHLHLLARDLPRRRSTRRWSKPPEGPLKGVLGGECEAASVV
jgi:glyceraldehyde 3-phosphate dehydrogenase